MYRTWDITSTVDDHNSLRSRRLKGKGKAQDSPFFLPFRTLLVPGYESRIVLPSLELKALLRFDAMFCQEHIWTRSSVLTLEKTLRS